jgi:hypothetical protein
MHCLSKEMLYKEVAMIGLSLQKMHFPGDVTMTLYIEIMKGVMQEILN